MPSRRPLATNGALPSRGTRAANPEATPAPEPITRRQRLGFRITLFLLPLLLLALAEMALRLAGWGFPTSLFLKTQQEGKPVLIENPQFGWRFFPPSLARAPLPTSLPATKPAGVCRVLVLGESAAMGDPEPAYGFARQLERLLQARHPERKIEVINLAMTAINSHVIREIAHDCVPLEADAWVIYAGNNEVVGPFGAGTVFGAQAPKRSHIRATLALRCSRLGQLAERCLREPETPEWLGLELFLQHQVPADDPRLLRVYDDFALNLGDIVAAGGRARAKVVLTTSPVNLTTCPPFASRHRPGLSAAELAEWDQHFAAGCRAESDHRFTDALAAYRLAAALDSEFAELIFRRAACEHACGSDTAANVDFHLARDLDTLRFRADSHLNDIVRDVARATGVALVDAEAGLGTPPASPEADLFYDHVHPNFRGHSLLAARFAATLERELFPSPSTAAPDWLREAELASRLAFTDFDRRRVLQEMRARLRQPPFKSQLNFQARDEWLRQELAAPATALRDLAPVYRNALTLGPDDSLLRANFARLLEAADDPAGAAEQWRQYGRLLPHEPDAWFHLGNLEYNAGRLPDAARFFQQALACRPACVEALNGLGLALAAQGKRAEAIRQFEALLRADPRFSAARVNLALVLATRGDTPAAIDQYRTTLRLDPDNVAARINLARLLSGLGQAEEAIALYGEALQFKPDDAVAHFDLANALAARNQHAEALSHYAAAARQQPGFAQARYNLAVELARAGKIPEALGEFTEAVRLEPDSPEVRYNYGIALAKVHRYPEAVQEFQEALKRKPGFLPAQAALDRAQDLAKAKPGP